MDPNYRNNCYKFNKTGKCILFTGLQCSGKTTIAKRIAKKTNSILLDGDALRTFVNYDLGFSKDDVTNNLRKAGGISKILLDQGFNVLISCVSKNSNDRKLIKDIVGESNYIEIFVCCNDEELNKRRKILHPNTKVLFNDYEVSDYDVIKINTSEKNIEECTKDCLNELQNKYGIF